MLSTTTMSRPVGAGDSKVNLIKAASRHLESWSPAGEASAVNSSNSVLSVQVKVPTVSNGTSLSPCWEPTASWGTLYLSEALKVLHWPWRGWEWQAGKGVSHRGSDYMGWWGDTGGSEDSVSLTNPEVFWVRKWQRVQVERQANSTVKLGLLGPFGGVHPAGHGHHMGSEYRSDTVHLVYLVL